MGKIENRQKHIDRIDKERMKVREKLVAASYRANLLLDELHSGVRTGAMTTEDLCWSYVNDLYEDVDKLINALDNFKGSLDALYDELDGEYEPNPEVYEAPRLYK